MIFNIWFTKLANKYFFISNLSNWHFSCTPYYNEDWIAETGPLSGEEKKALEGFAKIHSKYGFGENYLGVPFFIHDEEKIWSELKNHASEEESKQIRHASDLFESRFLKIWNREKSHLEQWKNYLEKTVNDIIVTNPLKDLEVFFGHPPRLDKVYIFLLLSTKNGGCGGSALRELDGITIECSAIPLDQSERILNIVIHELTHLVFEYGSYKDLLSEFVKQSDLKNLKKLFGRPPRMIFNEAVHASITNGHLGGKYFGRDVEKEAQKLFGKDLKASFDRYKSPFENCWRWEVYIAARMQNLTQEYIENGKAIDKSFLEEIRKELKRFLGEDYLSTSEALRQLD